MNKLAFPLFNTLLSWFDFYMKKKKKKTVLSCLPRGSWEHVCHHTLPLAPVHSSLTWNRQIQPLSTCPPAPQQAQVRGSISLWAYANLVRGFHSPHPHHVSLITYLVCFHLLAVFAVIKRARDDESLRPQQAGTPQQTFLAWITESPISGPQDPPWDEPTSVGTRMRAIILHKVGQTSRYLLTASLANNCSLS